MQVGPLSAPGTTPRGHQGHQSVIFQYGSFAGSPQGCDSNLDSVIDAGDLICTVLTIFQGPGACTAPAEMVSAAATSAATLALPAELTIQPSGLVTVPISFAANGNSIAAAAFALDDDSIPVRTRTKYKRRLEKLVAMLSRCGFQCKMPGGTYFLYTKAPSGLKDGTKLENAEAASQFLITQQSIVTVPWDDAGPFLRFSVTYEAGDEKAEDQLMSTAEERLAKSGLVF